MHAEIISIGDELTSGQRLDTNTQWISQRLGELGIVTRFHTTVADDLAANIQVFRLAIARADIVISSGGLGPTADDLTREAIAAAIGRPLVEDADAMAYIASLFARRGRPMPERNRVQAQFPAGSRVVHNPNGTAPGIDLSIPREGQPDCRLFALPGVPAELFEMWKATVGPALTPEGGPRQVIRHRRIKCFGAGESQLEQMLPDLIRRGREPSVGITVHEATITLRITSPGETPEACFAAMESTEATIRECLGTLVFGEEDDELEHAVSRLLTARGETLATAEGGTGGQIARWLTSVPGHEAWYAGGTILSNIPERAEGAGVPAELMRTEGAISRKVAAQMATSAKERFGADYGLAITAFPALDPSAASPPKLYLALARQKGGVPDVAVHETDYAGHPAILKSLAGKRALNLLRLVLQP